MARKVRKVDPEKDFKKFMHSMKGEMVNFAKFKYYNP